MPRRAGKKASKSELQLPSPRFPWRIGDIVEMETEEVGYRGAWFRVEIKSFRQGKHGKLFCTVIYKDYPDESEEEVVAIGVDPVTRQNTLMIRPLPPPTVKESTYDDTEELNTLHMLLRDHWETGDLVDWWYHDCWWSAEVKAVLGEGRFEIECPPPPEGEGGIYMAKESDMRASLNWSLEEEWTAPQSKIPGMKQCARLVGPALCEHAFPVRFLEPGEQIEEHVKRPREVDRIQTSTKKLSTHERNRERYSDERSSRPRIKHKVQVKGGKQPQAELPENLDNWSEGEGHGAFNRKVYPVVRSDEILVEASEDAYVGGKDFIEHRAMTMEQDEHDLNDKVMSGQHRNMAEARKQSGFQLEFDIDSECVIAPVTETLKGKRQRRRLQKLLDTKEVTSGQPLHHDSDGTVKMLLKNVSTPRAEHRVMIPETSDAPGDDLPRNNRKAGGNRKAGYKSVPGQMIALMCDVQVGEIQKTERSLKTSVGHRNVGLERAPPEMGVLFDVCGKNVERNVRNEKKRKRIQENITEEPTCVKHKGRSRPRKNSERSRHFDEEQRGFGICGKVSKQKGGINKEVETELRQNSKGKKKRQLESKIALEFTSGVQASWKEEAFGETKNCLFAPGLAEGSSVHEVQRENQLKHPRGEFQACSSHPEAQLDYTKELVQRGQGIPREAITELGTEMNALKKISNSKVNLGQDLKTKHRKKSAAKASSGKEKVQGATSNSCMPGISTDSLQQEVESDRTDKLDCSLDGHSVRDACLSANPAHDEALKLYLEGSGKPVNSNEVHRPTCGSLGDLSEGTNLSSGTQKVLNDSAVGLQPDGDSCSGIFACRREVPSDDCVQDPPLTRGLLTVRDTTYKLTDYSILKKLVHKPVITYKNVLSRKLVSTARRELWWKGIPLAKRKIF